MAFIRQRRILPSIMESRSFFCRKWSWPYPTSQTKRSEDLSWVIPEDWPWKVSKARLIKLGRYLGHSTEVIEPPTSFYYYSIWHRPSPPAVESAESFPEDTSQFESYYLYCKASLRDLYDFYGKPPTITISRWDFVWSKISIPVKLLGFFEELMIRRRIFVEDSDMDVFPVVPQVTRLAMPVKVEVSTFPASGSFVMHVDASIYQHDGDSTPTVAYAAVIVDANFRIWAYYSVPSSLDVMQIKERKLTKDGIILDSEINGLDFGCCGVAHSIKVGRLPFDPDFDIRADSRDLVKYMGNSSIPPDAFVNKIILMKKRCASIFGSYRFTFVHREGNRLADFLANLMAKKRWDDDFYVETTNFHSFFAPGFRFREEKKEERESKWFADLGKK